MSFLTKDILWSFFVDINVGDPLLYLLNITTTMTSTAIMTTTMIATVTITADTVTMATSSAESAKT